MTLSPPFLIQIVELTFRLPHQLVDQNTALKKDVAIAERKLIARNERIQNIEASIQATEVRVASQNLKYEAAVMDLRARIDQMTGKTDPTGFSSSTHSSLTFLSSQPKIDRPPLRVNFRSTLGGSRCLFVER